MGNSKAGTGYKFEASQKDDSIDAVAGCHAHPLGIAVCVAESVVQQSRCSDSGGQGPVTDNAQAEQRGFYRGGAPMYYGF